MRGSTLSQATETLDHLVVEAFLEEVRRQIPGLAGPTAHAAQLEAQAHHILRATHARLDPAVPAPLPPRDSVGRARATSGVAPSESLKAAGILFQVALPRLLAFHAGENHAGDDRSGEGPERVALALYASITDRVIAASVSYFDGVLDRLNSSHLEERRRISRELHDRTSHGIGAAMQGVELVLYRLEHGETPDMDRLLVTQQILRETLEDVRAMASLLRDTVGDRPLVTALREYLEATAPPGLTVELREEDDASLALQGAVAEEAYLILREAIRNSLLHAPGARRLEIVLSLDDRHLVARVVDDGPGFDPTAVGRRRTVGLASMGERAEALGGTVVVDLPCGGGVSVLLRVPVTTSCLRSTVAS